MPDKIEVFESHVRERAFRLWEEAGCPEGRAEEFWQYARQIEMQESGITEADLEAAEQEPALAPDPADFAEF